MLLGNIEAERERSHMSREYVANAIGVTVDIYTKWVQGEVEIPCSVIGQFARLWEVSSDYLLGLTDRRRGL